ncbi:MAG: type 1 glutamine amidotransferase [Myxococcota bacterium]
MGKKVVIVKNIRREGPGAIESLLAEKKLAYKIVDLESVDKPPSLEESAALIVMGGPDSANDDTEKIKVELDLIREAIGNGIPYLGICLGLQLGVKALGGAVVKSPVKEVGWRDGYDEYFEIALTPEGRQDPLFQDLPLRLKIFHLHGETVELTPEMTLLASGIHCKNQAVKLGERAYGIQGHFELTEKMLREWLKEDPDLKSLNASEMLNDYNALKFEYSRAGKAIIGNFLTLAFSATPSYPCC